MIRLHQGGFGFVQGFPMSPTLNRIAICFFCISTSTTHVVGQDRPKPTSQPKAKNSKHAATAPRPPSTKRLTDTLGVLVKQGDVLGAQYALARKKGPVQTGAFGIVAPVVELPGLPKIGGETAVTDETMFCVGWCSEGIACVIFLTLVQDKKLDLDDKVDKWLPELGRASIQGSGESQRAPTVRELLCHRGGVFSQYENLSPNLSRALYDNATTLAHNAKRLANIPLVSTPGERFAYSAAGYSIAGRIAEMVAEAPFEDLLQARICEPLKLQRTTYFPKLTDSNLAIGALKKKGVIVPNEATLLNMLDRKLCLVGGGLHSTAKEMALVGRMFLHEGKVGKKAVLTPASMQLILRRPYADQPYGLGWVHHPSGPKDTATTLSRGGRLQSYRSLLRVDLTGEYCVCVLWTLSDVAKSDEVLKRIADAVGKNADDFGQAPGMPLPEPKSGPPGSKCIEPPRIVKLFHDFIPRF